MDNDIRKRISIRDFLNEEIRSKISLLKSAFDANNDALLPKIAEEWNVSNAHLNMFVNPKV